MKHDERSVDREESSNHDEKWLIALIPYLPPDPSLKRSNKGGEIHLLLSSASVDSHHASSSSTVIENQKDHFHLEKTTNIGRLDILKSISEFCTESETVRLWHKYGSRYLNKNMLQFSFPHDEIHKSQSIDMTRSRQKKHICFVQPCGKNILPSILINGHLLSTLSKQTSPIPNQPLQVYDQDTFTFIVPCKSEKESSILEISYRIVFRYFLPTPVEPWVDPTSLSSSVPSSYKSSIESESPILSLYHFSQSYETLQNQVKTKNCSAISTTIPLENNTVSLHPVQSNSILLSSLSTQQLQVLRDDFQVTCLNEMIQGIPKNERKQEQESSINDKFLHAFLTLAINHRTNNYDSSDKLSHRVMVEEKVIWKKSIEFPHLLRNVTVNQNLWKDLQEKDNGYHEHKYNSPS